jgi:TRAP-type mannitol/chloroaromatic compound transport system permease small subunit
MRVSNPIDRLSGLVGRTVSYVFLISVAVMVYEVVARYVFNAPTIWAHESTITLTAIGFAFGGVYTMQRRGHISITIIYAMFPARGRAILDVVNQLVILGYLGALIYGGAIVARKSWAVMETSGSAWNQPTPVVLKTALVVGAALMVLQASVHLVRALRRLFAPRNDA